MQEAALSGVSPGSGIPRKSSQDFGGVPEGEFRIIPPGIPVMAGFVREILPVLALLWAGMLLLHFLGGKVYAIPVGIWATVTTIMLWPVGRHFGLPYRAYRTPLFVLGVLSMAYIPFIGFVLKSKLTAPLPYTVKLILWLLLPLDLTIFAVLPSLRRAIGRPVRMFFRPDILFGDGRVLCCGIVVMILGIRYMLGMFPPPGVPIAIPKWNWWGITYAMAAGFIPMIPLRGIHKLITRMNRMLADRWWGWDGVIFKELLLIFTALSIGWGFHHVFMGAVPFTAPSWRGIQGAMGAGHHQLGWTLFILGALWLVVVRGGYKRRIGEPFIRETVTKTWVKEILLVTGLLPLFLGFMLLIEGHFGRWNPWPQWFVGLLFFLWGLAMLLPFRVWAQVNQRIAIVQQMAAVILPAHTPEVRRKVLRSVMEALAVLPERERSRYMQAMQEALAEADVSTRELMTQERLLVMSELPSEERRTLMRTMDALLVARA